MNKPATIAQLHEDKHTEPVVLVCVECGRGNYRRSALSGKVRCDQATCDHPIYSGDIELESGESLTWVDGALAYIPSED